MRGIAVTVTLSVVIAVVGGWLTGEIATRVLGVAQTLDGPISVLSAYLWGTITLLLIGDKLIN